MSHNKVSLYIHWPFCRSKCPYCDFNSHIARNINEIEWLEAYKLNIEYYSRYLAEKEVISIFFGGGTPSLAPLSIISGILEKIASLSKMSKDVEITLEANPTSVESSKFESFKTIGINRVSLGIQSFNQNNLKFLGREHSIAEAKNAIEIASKHFSNYSLDFIYALPSQTLDDWAFELNEIKHYISKHVSLYQLTIEKGTPFFKSNKNGEFKMPTEDLSADFYNLTQDIMWNMPSYEISNHAKQGYECKHNFGYWRYNEYLGIGPGAHGRYEQNGVKYAALQHHNPEIWLTKSVNEKSAFQSITQLNIDEVRSEKILMGMRLKEGMELGLIATTNKQFAAVEFLINAGILEYKKILGKTHIAATRKGSLMLNRVVEFII